MKKALLITALFIGSIMYTQADAQVRVSLNFNVGDRPVWAPVNYGYVPYYYMPDIGVYYDVRAGQYIYLDAGRWIFSAEFPSRYRGYRFYNGCAVGINAPNPYLHDNYYRQYYGGNYYNYRNYGDRDDYRYGRDYRDRYEKRGRDRDDDDRDEWHGNRH